MNGFSVKKAATASLSVATVWLSLLLGGCNPALHAYIIPGEAMAPLLHAGDRIFVDESKQACSDLHDGGVIAFRHGDAILIKRILAMPGETISGEHRKVIRDGKQLDESYLAPAVGEEVEGLASFPQRTIGQGEIFVMGDNRDFSLDSRVEGYADVRFSDVVGQYSWTYWHGSSTAK